MDGYFDEEIEDEVEKCHHNDQQSELHGGRR